jgi:hypothetical protein
MPRNGVLKWRPELIAVVQIETRSATCSRRLSTATYTDLAVIPGQRKKDAMFLRRTSRYREEPLPMSVIAVSRLAKFRDRVARFPARFLLIAGRLSAQRDFRACISADLIGVQDIYYRMIVGCLGDRCRNLTACLLPSASGIVDDQSSRASALNAAWSIDAEPARTVFGMSCKLTSVQGEIADGSGVIDRNPRARPCALLRSGGSAADR